MEEPEHVSLGRKERNIKTTSSLNTAWVMVSVPPAGLGMESWSRGAPESSQEIRHQLSILWSIHETAIVHPWKCVRHTWKLLPHYASPRPEAYEPSLVANWRFLHLQKCYNRREQKHCQPPTQVWSYPNPLSKTSGQVVSIRTHPLEITWDSHCKETHLLIPGGTQWTRFSK